MGSIGITLSVLVRKGQLDLITLLVDSQNDQNLQKKTTKNSTCKEAAVGSHQVSAVVNIRKMGDQDNKVCEWLERKVGMQSGRWMCGMDDGGGQERSGFIDGVSNEYLHKKMNGASGLRKRADTKVASREPPQTVAKTLTMSAAIKSKPLQTGSNWCTPKILSLLIGKPIGNSRWRCSCNHPLPHPVSERTFALANG